MKYVVMGAAQKESTGVAMHLSPKDPTWSWMGPLANTLTLKKNNRVPHTGPRG